MWLFSNNIQTYVHSIFRGNKCAYDSFPQIGYNFTIICGYGDSDVCKYLGLSTFDLFPEDGKDADETVEQYFEDIGYTIYNTYNLALEACIEESINLVK